MIRCLTKPYAKTLHTDSEIEDFSKYYPSAPSNNAKFLKEHANPSIRESCCGLVSFEIKAVKAGDIVLYFGTASSRKVVDDKTKAYDRLQNQGMRKARKDGVAKGYLYCPAVYINPNDKKAHPRHIHYAIWNRDAKAWGPLYTLQILANVGRREVESGDFVVFDALPAAHYAERHIPGALSLPYDEPVTARKVQTALKTLMKKRMSAVLMKASSAGDWKHTPIIVYCWNAQCEAAECLKEKLDKIGVVNTWHFPEGLESL